jgi:glycosyltransferase involved in cell wall biosynthesis
MNKSSDGNDNMAKVTVIIPTYNRCESLPGVVESVLAQNCRDWCIRISDDCSTDATADMAKKIIQQYADYDIQYFCNSTNLKEYMNINAALGRNFSSKYVSVLQDDSRYLDANFLRDSISLMDQYQEMNWVAGHFKNNQGIVKLWNGDLRVNGRAFWRNWPAIWTFWPACVFRYDVIVRIGGLDTSIVARADSLLLLKMALLGEVGLLNRVVLEDEYNKKQGSYEKFYKDKVAVLKNEEKYFRSAADFAVLRGANAQDAEQWYRDRVASDALEKILDKQVDENGFNAIFGWLKDYDENIMQRIMSRLVEIIHMSNN